MRGLQEELRDSQVLVSCEGGAEDAIIRLLLDEGKLGMRAVKRPEEVRRCWTPTSLQQAAEQYASLHRFEKGEFSLADILG